MTDSEELSDERAVEVRSQIGDRIKEARERKGIRQKEIEADTGLHANTLRRYEQGGTDIPLPRLILLSDYLDTPLAYFLQDLSDDQTLALQVLEDRSSSSWIDERDRGGSRQLVVDYGRLPEGVENVEVGLSLAP